MYCSMPLNHLIGQLAAVLSTGKELYDLYIRQSSLRTDGQCLRRASKHYIDPEAFNLATLGNLRVVQYHRGNEWFDRLPVFTKSRLKALARRAHSTSFVTRFIKSRPKRVVNLHAEIEDKQSGTPQYRNSCLLY